MYVGGAFKVTGDNITLPANSIVTTALAGTFLNLIIFSKVMISVTWLLKELIRFLDLPVSRHIQLRQVTMTS